jgi:hypothetical protein
MQALPEGITEEDVFLVMPDLRDDPDIFAMVESLCRGHSAYRAAVLRFESCESYRSLDNLTYHIYRVRKRVIDHFRPHVGTAMAELRREGRVVVDPEIMNSLESACTAEGIMVRKQYLVVLR